MTAQKRAPKDRTSTRKMPTVSERVNWVIMLLFQLGLIVIGILGIRYHAYPIYLGARHEDFPIFDLTTLAWLIPIAFAILLPSVSEITWGNFSLKLRELREASDEYEKSLDNLANLVQNWSTSAAMYVADMRQSQSNLWEPKDKIYADYVGSRMGEAYEMLATKPGEKLRLGLWLYDPVRDEIIFVSGFGLKPKVDAYKPGEGMIGKSFTENRHFNEADVRKVHSYKSSREGEEPPYRAVLCEPVRWDHKPIGMITVDRSTEGFFDYLSEQIAQGLASQCALAVKVYEGSEAPPNNRLPGEPTPERD
jgi:putative methionine-R-sulfoxide reductase with GAF domain